MSVDNRFPERPWATGVLVMSGAISLSFNTVHSWHTELAPPLAILFGAGPVTLAAMQSHVVALQASRGELVGGWRRAGTFALVIGALALSFLGIYDLLQHQVVDPIKETPLHEPAVLTPIVVDLMAIAALAELLRPSKRPVTAERWDTNRSIGDRSETTPVVQRPVAPVMPPTVAADPVGNRAEILTTPVGGLSTGRPRPVAGPVSDRPAEVVGNHSDAPAGPVTNHQGNHDGDRSETGPATTEATTPEPVEATGRREVKRPVGNHETPRPGRPQSEENTRAVAMYRQSVADGNPMSQRVLAKEFNRSTGWARARIAEAGLQPVGRTSEPVGNPVADTDEDRDDDRSETTREATG
jgi:hypothetical protein